MRKISKISTLIQSHHHHHQHQNKLKEIIVLKIKMERGQE